MRVAVGVLPLRRALPSEQWLKCGCNGCYPDPRGPRALAIHVDIQLRNIAVVAGIRFRDPGDVLDRLEHLVCRDLETRFFRALNIHGYRLSAPAKDGRRVLDGWRDARNLPELAAESVLNILDRSRTMRSGLEANIDGSGVRRAAESGADCCIGELGFRLLPEERGNLFGLVGRVPDGRAWRGAHADTEFVRVRIGHPRETKLSGDEHGDGNRAERTEYHGGAMLERPLEPRRVVVCRLLEPCVEAQRNAADGITDLPVIHFSRVSQLVLELRVWPDARQHRIERE